MTESVADALAGATRRLAAAGVESPRADAEVLLADVSGTARGSLSGLSRLSDETAAGFRAAVARRETREPLQHITGRAAFRYLDLEVGPGAFTPRSETEVMAGVAVDELNRLAMSGVASPLAVDLCTGSGAVAIAMATEVPVAKVVGVELSAAAHRFALRNARGSGVDMRLGDIAVAVDDLAGAVHVVVANPPYIPLAAYEHVETEARDFDPPLALWSGVDGLDMIALVADVAARLLVADGLVACEHADLQGEAALALFAATGNWTSLRDHRDLADRPRFVTARRVARGSRSAGTMSS